ncbi:MAG: hypothetical protein ACRCYX_00905 [Dermatophilaceae bacterium]
MGEQLDVTGGAGGVTANLADLRAQAGLLRGAGTDLLEQVDAVSAAAVDEDVLAAAIICPDLVPGVEAAVLAAATGPEGLATRGGELLVSGALMEASVTTYEAVDATAAATLDALQYAAGFAVGGALPGAALGAGVLGAGLLALSARNPTLARTVKESLTRYASSGEAGDDLSGTLYDHPWMMEALTRGAPGLMQGTSVSLAALLGPHGLSTVSALTGGRWPSADYETSVAGIIAIGQRGGAFVDDGTFTVAARPRHAVPLDEPGAWSLDSAVENVFIQQRDMDDDVTPEQGQASGQVQVVTVPQPDGSSAYVVQIPGTESWSTTRGSNPVDLTSNLTLMTGGDSVWRQTVVDAIREHVPMGAPVMLTGHSQGGITAASIASDPMLVGELNIRSVVTGGSPIGRFEIDPSVSVLSVEHQQDPVPMLDGTANPDRPNHVTVRHDLADEVARPNPDSPPSPTQAHSTDNYGATGALIDASNDPSIQRWREENAMFFTGSEPARAARYDVTPTGHSAPASGLGPR